jgi:hypothetical protein
MRFRGGPTGTRTRDLRIKRPDIGSNEVPGFPGSLWLWLVTQSRTADQPPSLSGFSTPSSPDSDDDVMSPLRRVTTGSSS